MNKFLCFSLLFCATQSFCEEQDTSELVENTTLSQVMKSDASLHKVLADKVKSVGKGPVNITVPLEQKSETEKSFSHADYLRKFHDQLFIALNENNFNLMRRLLALLDVGKFLTIPSQEIKSALQQILALSKVIVMEHEEKTGHDVSDGTSIILGLFGVTISSLPSYFLLDAAYNEKEKTPRALCLTGGLVLLGAGIVSAKLAYSGIKQEGKAEALKNAKMIRDILQERIAMLDASPVK